MSGTCLIDVSEDGDLPDFLRVDGSHDCPLDSFGIIKKADFTAYPWSTFDGSNPSAEWKAVDTIERRAPSGKIVEQWIKAYESCHGRNDLAAEHDPLITWKLPSGDDADALTIGGDQFNGHVFCLRSWWKHITRQRYAIERAINTGNLWTGIFGNHSGNGTVSGASFAGATTSGALVGPISGAYTIEIAGSLTGAGPDGSFSGTISGVLEGTIVGTIVAGVVSTTYTITNPSGVTVTQIGATFAVGGGGTTFTFTGAFSGTTTSTLDFLAETYLNFYNQWSLSAGPTPIRNGKFRWGLGWRRLLFPWSPLTTRYGEALQRWAIFSWNDSGDDWDEANPSWTRETNWSTACNGTNSANVTNLGLGATKTVRYAVYSLESFACSSGLTVTRPPTTLRNLYGWDEDTVLRVKGTYSADGLTTPYKIGFFWLDQPWSLSLDLTSYIRDDQTVFATMEASETNHSLASVIDIPWPVRSGSAGVRIPCFVFGPEWGAEIPDPGPDAAAGDGYTNLNATDDASTAGINHLVRLCHPPLAGNPGPRIGTTRHPFFTPAPNVPGST